MRAIPVVMVLLALSACAAHRPPQTVPEDFTMSYGCVPKEVQQRADQFREQMDGPTSIYIPQTGWTACELIAHNGRPSEVDRSSGYGQTQHTWWYEGNTDMGMVTLEPEGGEWIVTYVNW